MRNYLRSWDFMRLFRLAMGVIIVIQGWTAGYWLIVGIGLLFTILPLLNINTCNTPVCNTSRSKSVKSMDEVTYEEVK